jgi:hypothetical protein
MRTVVPGRLQVLSKQAGLARQLECVGYPRCSLLQFRDAAGKDSLCIAACSPMMRSSAGTSKHSPPT